GVQIEPSAESEAVLEINPFLVAPERKRARAEVGDKRVFHFFPRPCGSERKCVRIRHTDRSARIGDAANILVEAGSEWRAVEVVSQIESPDELLADATGDIGLIVERIIGSVVLIPAHPVEAGKISDRVRTVGTGHTIFGGDKCTMK